VLPLTSGGSRDESEYAGLNAFTLAIDEMNQRGGAGNGRLFALWVCDTRRDTAIAKSQAGWLAEKLNVPAIFTSGSQQSLDVSAATRGFGTLIMSPTATSPDLVAQFHSETLDLLWRTAPPDTLQGRVLANLLLTDPTYAGVSRVGIIYVGDAYGQGLFTELRNRLTSMRTVVSAPFTTGMDVTAAVNGLGNPQPVDATVVIGVTSDTKNILTAAFAKPELGRDAGHQWAFADASKDPDILTVPGARFQLAGSLGTAPAQGAGVPFPAFRDAYRIRFGLDPSSFSFTSHSYDAMYLVGLAASYASSNGRTLSGRTMAEGMTRLVSTGPAVNIEPASFSSMRNTISAGQPLNVEGNSGKLDFIPDAGAPYSLIEQWRIEPDGGFTIVTLIDPPTN
jgi:branched-chain amino acid transport system substrate-binding protein